MHITAGGRSCGHDGAIHSKTWGSGYPQRTVLGTGCKGQTLQDAYSGSRHTRYQDAYEALPELSSPPTVVTRTLQEHTTKSEYDKAVRALTNQRGRIHAYPPIQATVWPNGESAEVVE